MKNIAIITEYNPFHKGHAIQLDIIRAMYPAARIISIMSGNTVQRGEVALYDKYLRAQAAILHGVSAVFEIPFPYSCSCGEIFAKAGVHIANSLGNIDALVFGSESGELSVLEKISENLSSKEYQNAFESFSRENKNVPYPKRRERVYESLYGEGSFTSGANDILGIEYISAIKKMGAKIVPVTYKREAGYTASGTRNSIRNGEGSTGLDEVSLEVFGTNPHTDTEKSGELILQVIKRESRKNKEDIFDMPRDLWQKMKDSAFSSCSYSDFMGKMKGSGYTDARIRRELMYLWCGVDKIEELPAYTMLLGADEMGREYLSQIRKSKSIEILTKPADYVNMSEAAKNQYQKGIISECLFGYALTTPLSYADMMRKGPYIKR